MSNDWLSGYIAGCAVGAIFMAAQTNSLVWLGIGISAWFGSYLIPISNRNRQ